MRSGYLVTIFSLTIFLIGGLANSQDFTKQILLDGYFGREAEFGDFDRDGDLDILMFYHTGDIHGPGYTRILENKGSEFTTLDVNLSPVETLASNLNNGSANWIDYNSDGFLDIFLVIGLPASVETKLYINNGDKTFSEKHLNITDLIPGSCGPSWSDYDNDGDLDLTIMGDKPFEDYRVRIYKYSTAKQMFSAIDYDFGNSIIKSRKPWADFNNDGYLDLLVNEPSGSTQTYLAIYKNEGGRTFSKIVYSDLRGLNDDVLNQNGDMRWGDYNNDGFLDIFISGRHTSYTAEGISYLYRNNGDETFTKVDIDSVYNMIGDVSVEWGDYDNDGDLDILQTGELDIHGVMHRTRIYANGNSGFTNSGNEDFLRNQQLGMSTWGDCNNDNKLDLLVFGRFDYHSQIALYKNNSAKNNTPPQAPDSLNTHIGSEGITLSWAAAYDAETEQKSLTYNVYLIFEDDTIVQPNSLKNGKRIIVDMGNAQHNTFYKPRNLKAGVYKWGVQSVDNSFIGSEFSHEETFQLGNVSSINDQNLELDHLQVHPNPFNNELGISILGSNNSAEIRIFDINGKLIYSMENASLPHIFDTNFINPGVYILSVSNESKVFTKKIVKNY